MSRSDRRLWLLPLAALLAALLLTLAIRGRDTPQAAPIPPAAQTVAPATGSAARPSRVVLARVRDIPAPLATPVPRRVAPARIATPTPTPTTTPTPSPTPVETAVPVPAAPSPAARPAPRKPKPTPAPTFDDAGSGPDFDRDGP